MKTISREFEGIYGNGKPLGIRTNKTINNMLQNIPTKQYESNAYEPVPKNVSEPAEFPWGLIMLFIVLMIIWFLYYYRGYIYNLLLGDKQKEIEEKKKQEENEKAEREENEKNSIKEQTENEIKKQEEINKRGIKHLDD